MPNPSLNLQGPPQSGPHQFLQSCLMPLFNHTPAILIFFSGPLTYHEICGHWAIKCVAPCSFHLDNFCFSRYQFKHSLSSKTLNILNSLSVSNIYSHSFPHNGKLFKVHKDCLFNSLSTPKTNKFSEGGSHGFENITLFPGPRKRA